jgi:VWFA-related protein
VQPPLVFETAVDLVSVDASVLDAKGVPVRGLSPDDFRVTVDGKPRRVLSAEFVDLGAGAGREPPARAAHVATNEGLHPGRLVILAVDQGQITSGQGRALIRSADSLLDQLTPADRIGFLAFPAPAPAGIEPTADHAKVRTALAGVVGRAPRLGSARISPSEALAQRDNNQLLWDRALDRECPASMDMAERQMCLAEVEGDAMQVTAEMQQRTAVSLSSLRALFDGLAAIEGPKTVVLLTEALFAEPAQIRLLAERASSARVTLYVLQLESPRMADASVARPSETPLEDEDLRNSPLTSLAALARGAVFRATGSGEGIYERIARELTGHYVLGVEPEAADRDGREHAIRVGLERSGLTLRARTRVSIPKSGSGPTMEQRLAATLRSPFAETGLLIRGSSFVLGGHGAPGHLRVVVAAEVTGA